MRIEAEPLSEITQKHLELMGVPITDEARDLLWSKASWLRVVAVHVPGPWAYAMAASPHTPVWVLQALAARVESPEEFYAHVTCWMAREAIAELRDMDDAG